MRPNAARPWMTFLLLAGLSWAVTYADTVDFTLTHPMQTVTPGGTLSFTAMVNAPLNNGAPVYLNADTYSLDAPVTITVDDSSFVFNFPPVLNPGDSTTDVLFNVTVPLNEALGSYTGSFTLQGGADSTAEDVLASDPFTLDVTSGTPVTASPEPSSLLLCLSGVLGLSTLLHRRLSS